MNHIYRLVWSQVNQAWVAVAENARAHGTAAAACKLLVAATALAGSILPAGLAYAADAANATVVGGTGTVSTAGATTTINQASQRLAIDWTSLSTVAGEKLNFVQPNAQAIALNRITGSSPSTLLGSLTANGQVYILNPNGVLFGAGAQVNVGGIVASTLGMTAADFMQGSSSFSSDPARNGNVVNQGQITAADGGYVALISGTVRNEGTISSRSGTSLLAAGNKVTLNFNQGSLLGYSIDQGALHALVENKQLIQADGGQVLMAARALDQLSTAVINNTGIVEARTVQNKNGRIMLMADMNSGTVNLSGTLDASAPLSGDGGFIETSAAHVKVADGTKVTTRSAQGAHGTWLIDPNDFTVAASGGDISGATLSSNLDNGNVQLQSTAGAASGNGDININDAVSWNAATRLTLTAQRNISINRSITAGNANGKLALEYGQGAVSAGNNATYNVNAAVNLRAGDNFSTRLGSDGAVTQYKVITALGSEGSMTGTDLQGINGNQSGNYVLGADIDAAAAATWSGGAGFAPVSQFFGVIDGLGHEIRNLRINQPGTASVGLIAVSSRGAIRNLGLVNVDITGASMVGALIGLNSGAAISNVYVTGSVTGASGNAVGGMIGQNATGNIVNSHSRATVTGSALQVGGLVGANGGVIDHSYATGTVNARANAGGLVGINYATITASYATGSVNGASSGSGTGGLVGNNATNAIISSSYATGNVTAGANSGGLVGFSYGGISNSYSSGNVSGTTSVGGLIGSNLSGVISNTYATGNVSGNSQVGLLAGQAGGTIKDSFWLLGNNSPGIGIVFGTTTGVRGLSDVEFRSASTFAGPGWSMSGSAGDATVWRIYDGQTGPLLRTFLKAVSVTLNDTGKTYDGGTGVTSGYGISVPGAVLNGTLAVAASSKNAGSYSTANGTLNFSGLYSGQDGYDISYAGNSFTIGKANLTVTAQQTSKVYDGTTAAAGTAIAAGGAQLYGGDNLAGGAFVFADKNAGNGNKTVRVSGVTVNDGNGGNNYNVIYADNTTSTITPASLVVTASGINKVYDGLINAGVTYTANGVIGSDVLNVTGTASYADKNAGTGKTINVSNIALSGADRDNYVLASTSAAATADITPAALTVVANSVTRFYDGQAWTGNGGVTISGFVAGDTQADLQGTLIYGGTASGAIGPGNYRITPGGLNLVRNYRLVFVDGMLVIKALNQTFAALGGSAMAAYYDGAQQALASSRRAFDMQRAWHSEKERQPSALPQVAGDIASDGAIQLTPRLRLIQ